MEATALQFSVFYKHIEFIKEMAHMVFRLRQYFRLKEQVSSNNRHLNLYHCHLISQHIFLVKGS